MLSKAPLSLRMASRSLSPIVDPWLVIVGSLSRDWVGEVEFRETSGPENLGSQAPAPEQRRNPRTKDPNRKPRFVAQGFGSDFCLGVFFIVRTSVPAIRVFRTTGSALVEGQDPLLQLEDGQVDRGREHRADVPACPRPAVLVLAVEQVGEHGLLVLGPGQPGGLVLLREHLPVPVVA